MHIALYTPGWPVEDFQNGIVTYVKYMQKALQSLGHRVTVVTGKLGPSNTDPAVVEVAPDRTTQWRLRLRRKLGLLKVGEFGAPLAETFARLHARDPIDVIEMEESFGWFDAVQRLDLPLVVKLHGPAFLSLLPHEVDTPSAVSKIAAEGRALARADFITSPSVSTADATAARYGLPGPIELARNTVDASAMTQWRAAAAVPGTVLFVGRFDARKGADRALAAFKTVLAQKPAARLVFVGPDKGLERPDGSLQHFQEHAASVFTADELGRITYLGAQRPPEIERLRCEAQVVIIASRWENAPYTAAEALAQGCPVAAMDCPGVNEVVMHEQTGLLAADPAALASHVSRLLDDQALGARLGEQARRFIIDTHAPDVTARVAAGVYARALAKRGARRGG